MVVGQVIISESKKVWTIAGGQRAGDLGVERETNSSPLSSQVKGLPWFRFSVSTERVEEKKRKKELEI